MKIIRKPNLKMMSTLKMGGIAEASCYLELYRDLDDLAAVWPDFGPNILVHGKGSNTLFLDGVRDFKLIVWGKKDQPVVMEESNGLVRVMADTGMSLSGFLGWCAGHGLSGLEGLAGIPGSLGGAIAMNAGSFGTETADVLEGLTIWTPEQGITRLSRESYEAGYRQFKIKQPVGFFLILQAGFSLKKDQPEAIRKKMKKNYLRKKNSQPILESTAGCVFKNPDGFKPAGILLEKAGFRGKSREGVCFSAKHSNFLVNKGWGSSQAAIDLITEARESVFRLFGTHLEMELKVV